MAKTISKSKMTLVLDLPEMFGGPIESESLRNQIGQRAIDIILDRTASGTALGGGSFKGYSKAYKKSIPYRAFGKSGAVNLKLEGEMLGQLDITGESKDRIELGWQDDTQRSKAFNHHNGDTLPKRPFFGLTSKEKGSIVDEFAETVTDLQDAAKAEDTDEANSIILGALKRLLG